MALKHFYVSLQPSLFKDGPWEKTETTHDSVLALLIFENFKLTILFNKLVLVPGKQFHPNPIFVFFSLT